jgi:RNA polymerase sigma-70 factor (ECF subfamily)
MPPSVTDEELMTRAALGDEEAFQELTFRVRSSVMAFLLRLGCTTAEADDLVQETLVRLWVHRRGYTNGKPLRPYLLTIAKNVYVSYRRHIGLRAETERLPDKTDQLDRLLMRAGSGERGPEGTVIGRYWEHRLSQAVAALPETDRLVFVLRHYEGLKYREIGSILDIAEGTAKSRMFRAVRALRDALPDLDPNGDREEI